MTEQGKVVVLTGPSGVGKSTIAREVVKRTGAVFSVSATTRPPRQGETEGVDYRFVDRPTFEAMIRKGQLLEWAEVFGEYYGTPADVVNEAKRAGETILLDIDVQGGLQVREKLPNATFVLIVPPDKEILAERLRRRRSESDEQFRTRLAKATEEVAAAEASGVYRQVVVNDELERAVRQVVEIVGQENYRND